MLRNAANQKILIINQKEEFCEKAYAKGIMEGLKNTLGLGFLWNSFFLCKTKADGI